MTKEIKIKRPPYFLDLKDPIDFYHDNGITDTNQIAALDAFIIYDRRVVLICAIIAGFIIGRMF